MDVVLVTKNEISSKALLRRFGIATTSPALAGSAAEALAHVQAMGRPCALKVVSADIVHKFAAGGVVLGVEPAQAEHTFTQIMERCQASHPAAHIEGVLVEAMIPSGLEVFIGARVSDEFGPVVLLGPGGTGVEQGRAPLAALAPLDEARAEALIAASFPEALGQGGALASPGARAALRDCLLAVAGEQGMLAQSRICELDINPVIIHGDEAVAVDAVVLENTVDVAGLYRNQSQMEAMIEQRAARLGGMQALFNPQALVFIGASTAKEKFNYRMLQNLVEFGFTGRLYPIHPTAQEICGLQAYASISDIPEKVDRALIAVRTNAVPQALAQCREKGVQVAQILTAGFSEFDQGAGEIEARIAEEIAKGQMRVVGPNCIGTFSAQSRMPMCAPRFNPDASGNITFFSQSGTYCGDLVRRAQIAGLPVGRALSCGNCIDLDLLDFLIHADEDPQTRIIAFYLESLKDPGLFFRYAAKIDKPIVILRGGATAQGQSAASSHTAALATDDVLWQAGLQQAGIIEVYNIDDLMDVLLALSVHGKSSGRGLALFGSGGGISVTASDCAARAGLDVVKLAPQTTQAVARHGNPGTSVANPIDIPVWGLQENGRFIFADIITSLAEDAGVDHVVVFVDIGWVLDFVDEDAQGVALIRRICESIAQARPEVVKVSLALRTSGDGFQADLFCEMRRYLREHNVAVFASTTRAIWAHSRIIA